MILITGAHGQIGTDLARELRARHGADAVLTTDLKPAARSEEGPSAVLDVTDADRLSEILDTYPVHTIYHLASILSARGEQVPEVCWDVNMTGLRHVLDEARDRTIKVFWPSSIAVFDPEAPQHAQTQQPAPQPATMYGITKMAGEQLCAYYAHHWGVDVRSLRFPGIISYTAPPGGGTTDYAVDIFYKALQQGHYTCFLRADTRLPMMYMPDAVKATLDLMDAPSDAIHIRTSYNLAAVSFTPEDLVAELQKHLPAFTCDYAPDFRQNIADAWPDTVNDARARTDWGWDHAYDLPALTADMLEQLSARLVEN